MLLPSAFSTLCDRSDRRVHSGHDAAAYRLGATPRHAPRGAFDPRRPRSPPERPCLSGRGRCALIRRAVCPNQHTSACLFRMEQPHFRASFNIHHNSKSFTYINTTLNLQQPGKAGTFTPPARRMFHSNLMLHANMCQIITSIFRC